MSFPFSFGTRAAAVAAFFFSFSVVYLSSHERVLPFYYSFHNYRFNFLRQLFHFRKFHLFNLPFPPNALFVNGGQFIILFSGLRKLAGKTSFSNKDFNRDILKRLSRRGFHKDKRRTNCSSRHLNCFYYIQR